MSKQFSEEISKYILEHYYNTSASRLSDEIAERFDLKLSPGAIRTYISKHGTCKNKRYLSDHREWLRNNWMKYTNNVELTEAFNQRFDDNRTFDAIKKYLKSVVPSSNYGHSGGSKPGEGSSVTAKRNGTETFKGGYWWVKIDNQKLPKKYTTEERYRNWKLKHHIIWEKHHGPIPPGCKVIFLDGDRNNFNIENLYCADVRVLTYLMRNNMWYSNGPLTLSSIKWAELKVVMQEHKLRNQLEDREANTDETSQQELPQSPSEEDD